MTARTLAIWTVTATAAALVLASHRSRRRDGSPRVERTTHHDHDFSRGRTRRS